MANERYVNKIGNSEVKDSLIVNWINIYTEKYKDAPMEFTFKDKYENKTKKITPRRDTAPQPIRYESGQLNIRKLNLVPSLSLSITDPIQRSEILIDNVFMNYEFLLAKFENTFEVSGYTKIIKPKTLLYELIKSINLPNHHVILIATLMQILCTSNEATLNSYYQSFALQMTSSLLGLYGISKRFTKFIDDCDQKSPQDCALLAPYQIQPLSSIKTQVQINYKIKIKSIKICQFRQYLLCEKNKIKIYEYNPSKSTSNVENKNYDDIIIPSLDDIFLMRVIDTEQDYSKAKVIVASEKNILVLNSDGKELLEISEKRDHKIRNVFLIGKRALLVVYRKKPYFDIYDIQDGQCRAREPNNWNTDSSNIVNLVVENPHIDRYNNEDRGTYVAYHTDKNDLTIFELYFEEKTGSRLYVYANKRKFEQYDKSILSMAFEESDSINYEASLLVTFANSNEIVLIHYDSLRYVTKTTIRKTKGEAGFVIQNFANKTVSLKDSKNKYHLYAVEQQKWANIDREFDKIRTFWNDGNLFLYMMHKNIFDVFIIKPFTIEPLYEIVHLVHSLQCDDNILDVILKGF